MVSLHSALGGQPVTTAVAAACTLPARQTDRVKVDVDPAATVCDAGRVPQLSISVSVSVTAGDAPERSPSATAGASGVYVAVSGVVVDAVGEIVSAQEPAPLALAARATEQPSLVLTPSVTLTVPVAVALPDTG